MTRCSYWDRQLLRRADLQLRMACGDFRMTEDQAAAEEDAEMREDEADPQCGICPECKAWKVWEASLERTPHDLGS